MKRPRLKSHHHKHHRAKQTAVQFSFCFLVVFMFHRGIQTANNATVITDSIHQQTFMEASRKQTRNKATTNHGSVPQPEDAKHGASSSLASSPTNDSFWLDNLDTSNPVQCGANKCFFESTHDYNIGYLVSPQKFRFEHRNSADQVFATLQASFEFAQYLTQEYHVQHFTRTLPINITLSKTLASHLNSNTWSEARQVRLDKRRFKSNQTAFVQMVNKFPTTSLLFGCTASKRGLFLSRVHEFMTHVDDKEAFAKSFAQSMNDLRQLLSAETCLYIDFHALIGVDGQVYHLDLDRCFSNSGTKKKKKPSKSCSNVINNVEKRIQKELLAMNET